MSQPHDDGLSKVEHIKIDSRQLRGTIVEELQSPVDHFCEDSVQLLKNHGTYQQDDRDDRGGKGDGGGKSYMFMVRSRIPGGKLTAEQFLAELDLCERFGNGTLRITTRQGFQLHGVLKGDLKATIRAINEIDLSTLAACGDVMRNVMCCPAPYVNHPLRDELQKLADRTAEHFRPRTTAYREIWLTDPETGESRPAEEFRPVEEPIYGERYLPRKFKAAFALPEDNCVDVYTQDLAFVAVVEGGRIVGYNVLVGGGMGMTPANKKTFPAVAQRMAFVDPEGVLPIAEAVVKVQRDNGNRADRKQARLKYLLANWGLERFKGTVEEYAGRKFAAPHPSDVTGVDDHVGWHEQGDGRWFLGVNVENGRLKDEGDLRLKAGFREVFRRFGMRARLTALQGVILCDVESGQRAEIDRILSAHGIKGADELTLVRRYAMACPALPTCGLSVTESERVFPQAVDQIEAELARQGLPGERIAVHMTGCPNGCARPYTPDVGLVGKSKLKYTMYLGGNPEGTRLAFLYRDQVPLEEIGATLAPLIAWWKTDRRPGESFGDFCHRQGNEALHARCEAVTATG